MSEEEVVFDNLTAWFARSVSANRRTLWTKHGGKIVDAVDAQFIFSQDVEDPETKSLFDSEEYLFGNLSVFHAGFIDACLKKESAHVIPISNFILLPKDFPKVIYSIYIPEDKPLEDNVRAQSSSSARADAPVSRNRESLTTRPDVNRDDPVPGGGRDADILDSLPSGNRMADRPVIQQETAASSLERRNESETVRTSADKNGRVRSDETTKRQEETKGAPLRWNIDISNIPHVKDLQKASGPIMDFVVGRNGCEVCKVSTVQKT